MDSLIAKACLFARLNVAKLSVVHVLDNIPMPDTPYGAVIPLHDASENALLEQENKLIRARNERLENEVFMLEREIDKLREELDACSNKLRGSV